MGGRNCAESKLKNGKHVAFYSLFSSEYRRYHLANSRYIMHKVVSYQPRGVNRYADRVASCHLASDTKAGSDGIHVVALFMINKRDPAALNLLVNSIITVLSRVT